MNFNASVAICIFALIFASESFGWKSGRKDAPGGLWINGILNEVCSAIGQDKCAEEIIKMLESICKSNDTQIPDELCAKIECMVGVASPWDILGCFIKTIEKNDKTWGKR